MKEHKPVQRKLADLNGYDSNSRTHSDEQINQLVASINEFGFTNPILIDETNTIIAGHARAQAAGQAGLDVVPCVLLQGLDQHQKAALVIADNKIALNSGWNIDALRSEIEFLKDANFNIDVLGFDDGELNELFSFNDGGEDEIKAAVKFSEELDESKNYIVLTFSNDLDWLSALTHFKLESVHSKRANGKPWSKGIGRVVDGAKYLTELHNDN